MTGNALRELDVGRCMVDGDEKNRSPELGVDGGVLPVGDVGGGNDGAFALERSKLADAAVGMITMAVFPFDAWPDATEAVVFGAAGGATEPIRPRGEEAEPMRARAVDEVMRAREADEVRRFSGGAADFPFDKKRKALARARFESS